MIMHHHTLSTCIIHNTPRDIMSVLLDYSFPSRHRPRRSAHLRREGLCPRHPLATSGSVGTALVSAGLGPARDLGSLEVPGQEVQRLDPWFAPRGGVECSGTFFSYPLPLVLSPVHACYTSQCSLMHRGRNLSKVLSTQCI